MLASILALISSYGYKAIFILITLENIFPPIPCEIILTFGNKILDEKMVEQKNFLNVQDYSKKLINLVESTNEKSLIFSKQNDVGVEPLKYESIFIEKF